MVDVVCRNFCSGWYFWFQHRLARLADHLVVHVDEVIWPLLLHVLSVGHYMGGPYTLPSFILTNNWCDEWADFRSYRA